MMHLVNKDTIPSGTECKGKISEVALKKKKP